MVKIGLLTTLVMPWGLYFLDNNGHLMFVRGELVVDDVGRRALMAVMSAGLAAASVGWLLWTIGAAMNARTRSRWSISPAALPMAYGLVIGAGLVATIVSRRFSNEYASVAIAGVATIAVILHLGVVASFRRAAVSIGAPDAPWTRVMVLPVAIAGAAGFGKFYTSAIPSTASYTATYAITFLLSLLTVASLARAMASFDRTCVGRQMSHDAMEIPSFLRGPRQPDGAR